MFLKVFILFFAILWGASDYVLAEPTWTSLRVTFGLNLFSSRTFAKLPRRESKARSEGYTKLKGECSDGPFLGVRYIKGEDPTVVTLYDVNGFIAGLQHGIPKRDVDKVAPSYSYHNSSAYQLDVINGQEVYFLTAYFVDPRIICRNGRLEEEYLEDGTGTGLYLQNGTNPIMDSLHVPMYQQGIDLVYNGTEWYKGECKRGMGVHYWYDYSPDMNCKYFFPYTAIYNRGKLTSFAFVNFGRFEFSDRFEHPAKESLDDYMTAPLPQCILDEYDRSGGFSTMHVFFSVRPWNILC